MVVVPSGAGLVASSPLGPGITEVAGGVAYRCGGQAGQVPGLGSTAGEATALGSSLEMGGGPVQEAVSWSDRTALCWPGADLIAVVTAATRPKYLDL